MSTPGLWCVVPAAGRGLRVGGDRPKQYLPIAGRLLIEHTLDRLARHPGIVGLMVVLSPGDAFWPGLDKLHRKPVRTTSGGAERCDSVLAGLQALPAEIDETDFVLVHDAARPCVRLDDISRLIGTAGAGDGGLLGAPLRDTLKRAAAARSPNLATSAGGPSRRRCSAVAHSRRPCAKRHVGALP